MKHLLRLLLLVLLYSSSVKAETEPNNVWNQSNLVTIGATQTGTASINFDEDWWRVAIPEDGKLTVNWTSTNGSFVYCQIYDTTGVFLLTSAYTNTSAINTVDGLAKGTYYLRFITFYNNESTDYSFTPTFTATGVSNDSPNNNNAGLASLINPNDSITGHINYYFNNQRDTLDWYKINVVADGRLDFSLTSLNGAFVYADLFDGDQTTFLAGNYTNSSANYSRDGMAPGTYYIRIKTFYNNEFAPYNLKTKFVLPVNNPENSGAGNNTAGTATTILVGDSTNGHIGYRYNGTRDEFDWFKLTTSKDGRIDFTIRSLNGQNVYAQLFDGDQTTYLAGNYTTTSESYSKDGLAPGIYYIRVSTFYSFEFAPYSLKNNLVLPVNEAETGGSNETYATAKNIPLNDSVNGHIGYYYNGLKDTLDWYKVTTTEDGRIDINLNVFNGQYIYAQLFDGDGSTFLTGSYTTTSATYTKDGLAAGTYYIRIFTFYNNEFAPYALKVKLTSSGSQSDIEPNNSIPTASPIAVNFSTGGHIGYAYNGARDDIDFYSITLPEDGKLTLTHTSGNNQNVYLTLLDHDGSTVLLTAYTTGTTSQAVNNLGAGVYYLRVTTFYSSEFSPYSFSSVFEPMNYKAENSADNSFAANATLLPSNTPKDGHLNFYYNLNYDNIDWWVIGYDGTGAMTLNINQEQNHFNSGFPYIAWTLYSDTTLAPINSGQVNALTNAINFTGLSTRKYFLKLTPSFGSFGAYQLNAAYTERCLASATISSSNQTTGCIGNITYAITNGLSPYSVQLFKDGNAFGTPQTVTNSALFTNLPVGTYYAKITSFGGSGLCNNISINTVFTIPVSPVITPSGSTSICQGANVTLTSSAANSYLWSNGQTTQSINVTSAGSYSVTVSNSAGCSNSSASTTVTVNPNPTATINGSTTICDGGSTTLTASQGTSYLWSNGATTQSITVAPSSNASYSVTITNASGCSATASTNVTVNANPTASISGNTTICAGGSTTLTASLGISYLWNNGATTQSITVSPASNASYSVVVSYSGGCSATASTNVTVNANPTASISGNTTICAGGSTTLTASQGISYLWNNGATTQSITVSPASNASYSVIVSYAGGCSATASTNVTVNANPTASISGNSTICAGGSTTLTASQGISYLWNNGTTTQSITVSPASNASYSVIVSYAGGCSASASTNVTVNANPTASISGNTTICAGGSTTLTASQGVSYLWNNGATTQSITVSPASNASYSVIVSYAGGCSATASTNVTVNANPTASISGNTTICAGGSTTLTASQGVSYLWNNGATTQSITVSPASNATYSVVVSYSGGCSATASTNVTVNANPTASISGNTTICAGGSTTLTASQGVSYLWNNGATTQSITVSSASNASFSVVVSYASGCSATASANVIVNNCNGAYCDASGISNQYGYIQKVEIKTINNNSGWNNGYGNFLNQSATVAKGTSVNVAITPGFLAPNAKYKLYTAVWIDWNQDGDFSDAGETIYRPTNTANVRRTVCIRVPLTALTGTTRMRIIVKYGSLPNPCGIFQNGEVEDYTLNVNPTSIRVSDDLSNAAISMYPNPANNYINIESLVHKDNFTNKISILDLNGKLIRTIDSENAIETINTSELMNGIYIIQINTGELISTHKFLIQH